MEETTKKVQFFTGFHMKRSGPDGPAELGGPGSRIAEAFLGGGAGHIPGDLAVKALFVVLLEGLLHQPVLPGVEGEEGGPAAGAEDLGELIEEGVERLKFAVHVDAEGLEGPLAGLF